MNWIIGIDVGGNSVHYQIQSREGEKVAAGKAAKTFDGWARLEALCEDKGLVPGQTLVVLEATGRHHLPWCERLHAAGYIVYALNPLLSKRLYSSENAIRDNKDDALDARTLARIGRIHGADLERFAYRPQASRLQVQSLVSARKAIRCQCTNLLKAAGDLLQLVFPELKTQKLKLSQAGLRGLLRQAPTPELLARLPMETLRKGVGDKAEALREAAQASITPTHISDACSTALVKLLESIEDLYGQLAALEKSTEQALKQNTVDRDTELLIRTLPGFGKITAATITAFLPPDFLGWGSKKEITAKLQAYFGFDPRRRISGQHQGKVKISKRGIEIVRTAFYQASICSLRHDPQIKRYYDKKKDENDHHKKAVVDVMRKNLRRLVSVLVNRKAYLPIPDNA